MGDQASTSLRIDQPFKCEYAKSNRSACRGCKEKIGKEELRLAKMVKNPAFDGSSPHWYHFNCFFERCNPKSTGDMGHFSALRYEDQKRIEDRIGSPKAVSCDISDFAVEYSKSSRAACVLCEVKIPVDELRISKTDEESDAAQRLGRPLPRWFHVDCFVSARQETGYIESGEKLPGFDGLEPADQKLLKKKLPKLGTKRKGAEVKDVKIDVKKSKPDSKLDKSLKEQSDLLYSYIDKLKDFRATQLDCLLQYNGYDPPRDRGRKAEVLADALVFGALERCPECKNGQLYFRIAGYICSGMVSDCLKCVYETKTPARKAFKVPSEFKESHDFLASYKYKPRIRVMPNVQGPVDAVDMTKEVGNGNHIEVLPKLDPSKPLNGHKIVVFGKLSKTAKDLKKILSEMGAANVTNFDRTVLFGITNEKEIAKESDKVNEAKSNNVVLVDEKVIDDIKISSIDDVASVIVKHSLSEWGKQDVSKRYINLVNKSKAKSSKSGSGSSKSKSLAFPEKQTLVIKDGTAVDPQSELEGIAVVYKEGDRIYSEVLNRVDFHSNRNSYYKLQLLKDEKKKNRFWVFTAWGRTGTDIGGSKVDSFRSLEEARLKFEEVFLDKTGNPYSNRRNMVRKTANAYYPLDISYSGDGNKGVKMEMGKSELPEALQKLVMMMFDVQLMEREMKEFELDMTKMPLGKLSKSQILSAYNVLTEISKLIGLDPKKSKAKLISQSERFFTLIPHSFDKDRPPVLQTKDELEKKREMLDALMEMEIACELMSSVKKEEVTDDPIKQHYLQLKTDVTVLNTGEPEYKVISEYLINTHAKTHACKLKILEAFKICRFGEEERYKKHIGLSNKMLLWHGSRITNFASILSQGLRIAPPEAPVTGYMFGKGIYFADMATKSANYCHPASNNNIGLLALCEVALGEMLELTAANFITELPAGKNSVKGIGKTAPDPKKQKVIDGDVIVPCGPGISTGVKDTSLLYNEFIVYDVSQLKIRYLLMVEFDNKLF